MAFPLRCETLKPFWQIFIFFLLRAYAKVLFRLVELPVKKSVKKMPSTFSSNNLHMLLSFKKVRKHKNIYNNKKYDILYILYMCTLLYIIDLTQRYTWTPQVFTFFPFKI